MSRATILKAILFVAIVVSGIVAIRFSPLAEHLTREKIVALLEALRHSWWAPLVVIALYALTSPLGVPVSVYMAGTAAVFGFVAGSVYNLVGLTLGAASSYYLARSLGRDFVVHITRGRLRRFERFFERSGFWPLVQTRFLPIPFVIVNYGSALAGAKAPFFLVATAVGLVPAAAVHTYFIARISEISLSETKEGFEMTVLWYGAIMVTLNLLVSYPSIKRALERRRRYREIRARRDR